MPHLSARNAATIVILASIGIAGCKQTKVEPGDVAGNYVLVATGSSSPQAGGTFWADHAAATSDTFAMTITSTGVTSITGLRVSGYGAPGVTLVGESASTLTGTNAAHTLSAPTFLSGYSAVDTYTLNNSSNTLAIQTTATKASSPTLGDTGTFALHTVPSLASGIPAGYRLTVATVSSDSTTDHSAAPAGSTFDATLGSTGALTIDVDNAVVGNETMYLYADTASSVRGQYTVFNDATPANKTPVAIALNLTADGVTGGTMLATTNSQMKGYTLTAVKTSAIAALAGNYQIRDGSVIGTPPASYASWANAIDASTAAAPIKAQISSAGLLAIDRNGGAGDGIVTFAAPDEVLAIGGNPTVSSLVAAGKIGLPDAPPYDSGSHWTVVTYFFTAATTTTYNAELQFQAINKSTGMTDQTATVIFVMDKL